MELAGARPICLDLFCGAGGAARGYQLAGFYVVGVDINPQPRYVGDEFVQADALTVLDTLLEGDYIETAAGSQYYLRDIDFIHASPPCQGYSIMHNLPWLHGREYPLLLLAVYEGLEALGKPYAIENVMGARHGAKGLMKRGLAVHGLKAGWLCGAAFGLPFYRHRLFATNWFWLAPGHPKHVGRIRPGNSLAGRGRDIVFSAIAARNKKMKSGLPRLSTWQNGNGAQRNGVGVGHAKGWRLAAEAMGIDWMKRDELTQAIPPAYTHYIGKQALRALGRP